MVSHITTKTAEKKFASTLHQAQNLLSRQHSKDNPSLQPNDLEDEHDQINELTSSNTYKNSISGNDPAKSKLSTTTNDYDYQSSNLSLKKRDSSLDLKQRKIDPQTPSSSYLYGTSATTNNSTSTPNSASNRWPSTTTSKPQYSNYNKESYDNTNPTSLASASSLYDDNSTSENLTRRPNKYISSSKYSQQGTAGSKTERIISKSSKSSPNLLSKEKDYDRYDQTSSVTNKWLHTSSNNNPYNNYINHNHSQYHSSSNPYSSNNYNGYGHYQSQSNKNTDSTTTAPSSSAYNTHYNSNREEKWNELDSMLGAQSALLSRLESDFVANRNKLKSNTNLTNNIGSASTHQLRSSNITPSYQLSSSSSLLGANRYTGSTTASNQLSSKSQNNMASTASNDNESSLSSYIPSRYRTPTNKKPIGSALTSGNNTSKYTAKIDDIENENSKKQESYIKKQPISSTTTSYISSAKTEPLLDLIKSLDLNEENKKNSLKTMNSIEEKNLDESINKVLNDSINEFSHAAQTPSMSGLVLPSSHSNNTDFVVNSANQGSTNDFVDDFINDYINSTYLNSDLNSNANTGSVANNGSIKNLNEIKTGNFSNTSKNDSLSSSYYNLNDNLNNIINTTLDNVVATNNLNNEQTDSLGSLNSIANDNSW